MRPEQLARLATALGKRNTHFIWWGRRNRAWGWRALVQASVKRWPHQA